MSIIEIQAQITELQSQIAKLEKSLEKEKKKIRDSSIDGRINSCEDIIACERDFISVCIEFNKEDPCEIWKNILRDCKHREEYWRKKIQSYQKVKAGKLKYFEDLYGVNFAMNLAEIESFSSR